MKKRDIQFIAAYVIAGFGLALITLALFLPPLGEIHPSVVAAFGEILTFAGASIGMDYHYRAKYHGSGQWAVGDEQAQSPDLKAQNQEPYETNH